MFFQTKISFLKFPCAKLIILLTVSIISITISIISISIMNAQLSVGKTSTFFFSFISDKAFFVKDKRNRLKIKGMKVYIQKQLMTSLGVSEPKCMDGNTCLHHENKDFHLSIYDEVQTNIFSSNCSLTQ